MAGNIPFHRVIEVTTMLSDGVEWLCGKNEWISEGRTKSDGRTSKSEVPVTVTEN